MNLKRVLVLGSTGSIGESTLSVVENLRDKLRVVALAAHRQWEKLLGQCAAHEPEAVALTDPTAAREFERAAGAAGNFRKPRLFVGRDGLVELIRETQGDMVVGAISGAAGLPANLAALDAGKDLALANKESLVMSGAILTRRARERNRRLLPVDSEHSAIFQSLHSGRPGEVRSIILTASGGPFRDLPAEAMERVTKDQALRHPTWKMGAKITIDSATLMNKALEIIEARWLFDLPPEKIRVVIHPQSVVHSLVEFHDGSLVCQLGPPDMRIPIQYALTYPERMPLAIDRLELEEIGTLTFSKPDPVRFPALRLAYEVLRGGGTAPAVFNAANEVAVAAFLAGVIPFPEILRRVEDAVAAHRVVEDPTLEQIFEADGWAREHVSLRLPAVPTVPA
ncbi:MAG: 1-deoxy-D-xylulose-5-phosphate reductoisomerase [Planctomycetota bacterium]